MENITLAQVFDAIEKLRKMLEGLETRIKKIETTVDTIKRHQN